MDVKEGKRHGKQKTVLLVAACLLLAVGVSIVTVLFMQKRSDPAADTKAVSERIIKKVTALYLLSGEETPTVAKIQDKSGIQGNQEFYKNAQNGDYLLVYQSEKIAVIYRESIDKLISVRPVADTTGLPANQ